MTSDHGTNNPLSLHVRHTLNDLALVRQSLLSMSEEATGDDTSQFLDLELAAELKSVVDALRLLLWAYIKALSAKSGRQPAEVLNWYKMELAVEMLRSARTRQSSGESSISRFEHLVNSALATASVPKERAQ